MTMITTQDAFAIRHAVLVLALAVAGAAGAQAPVTPQPAPAAPGATPSGAEPARDKAGDKAGEKAGERSGEKTGDKAGEAATGPLAGFAWLAGCWRGTVNKREFREQWGPLRGGLMIGTSHTVLDGATQDFDYLRIESRPEGVFYVTLPQGRNPVAFKSEPAQGEDADKMSLFVAPGGGFPSRLIYRRGDEGWLYIHVEGKLNGQDRQVIYPMRRIDCETGEVVRQ
jgi:hypothetical protein